MRTDYAIQRWDVIAPVITEIFQQVEKQSSLERSMSASEGEPPLLKKTWHIPITSNAKSEFFVLTARDLVTSIKQNKRIEENNIKDLIASIIENKETDKTYIEVNQSDLNLMSNIMAKLPPHRKI